MRFPLILRSSGRGCSASFPSLKEEDVIIVSPIQALMQKVLPPGDLKESIFPLQVGEEIGREDLVRFLQENGYASARIVEERGDYSLRGAIVDVYPLLTKNL